MFTVKLSAYCGWRLQSCPVRISYGRTHCNYIHVKNVGKMSVAYE